MKQLKQILILALVLGFTACMNKEDSVTAPISSDSQPGQIQLVSMKGLAKVTSSLKTVGSSTTYTFDLDTANSSIQQYFLLQNTGDCDVKHVKLTTNNPNFYFSPSEIDILAPAKTSSLLQLVKLCVIHGTQINGVGPASQLPMGANIATASVSGTTSDSHHDSIAISQLAQFKVYAKIFDVEFYSFDSSLVDMSRNNFNFGGYGGITGDAVRGFYTGKKPLSSPTLRIFNSGNTSFKVKAFYNDANYIAVAADSMEVAPRCNMVVSFDGKPGAPLIQIDGHGVVAKSEKLWLQASVNSATNGKFTGIFYPSGW